MCVRVREKLYVCPCVCVCCVCVCCVCVCGVCVCVCVCVCCVCVCVVCVYVVCVCVCVCVYLSLQAGSEVSLRALGLSAEVLGIKYSFSSNSSNSSSLNNSQRRAQGAWPYHPIHVSV